jgi:MoaA/NifB/PqqE/SkfB family radical SAM enzyme
MEKEAMSRSSQAGASHSRGIQRGSYMKATHILRAWGSILRGRTPILSIEITKECPLRCPGCYAYETGHLGEAGPLRDLSDLKGEALVEGVLELARRHNPVHISIVGGEPLVRYRDLNVLLPILSGMGIDVQMVTSAVRPIPAEWRGLPSFNVAVSIDGLQPEHDRRRAPATYERILQNIAGHRIIVHCTVTRPLLERPGYLAEFAAFWSERPEVRKIWFSLYTPQQGDESRERLRPEDRVAAVRVMGELREVFPKIELPDAVMQGYLHPPHSPEECLFAQTSTCVSADLKTRITPCQFGGNPVCSECGCMASAGLAAVGTYKVGGLVTISGIYSVSKKLGTRLSAAS